MRPTLVAVAFSVLLSACGPGNSPVTLGGNTLSPRSSLMFSVVFLGLSATAVVVSDQADICSALAQRNPCASGNPFVTATGTSLIVIAPGTEAKSYPIADSKDFTSASLDFARVENGVVTFEDDATSGTVTLESARINEFASGRYDATMRSGTAVRGTFSGTYCKALEQVNPFASELSCDGTGTSSSCSSSCTCQDRTAKASCTRPSTASEWTCTCTSPTGATSTCTRSSAESSPCDEDRTCCNMLL